MLIEKTWTLTAYVLQIVRILKVNMNICDTKLINAEHNIVIQKDIYKNQKHLGIGIS